MDLLNNFRDYIKQHDLFHAKDKLLLAVSGGVDSVVLTELCRQAGFDFSIAHCNFKLRGADSDRDEAFVKGIAGKYAVPFFCKSFDTKTIAAERKTSIEETARDLRYEWFGELLEGNIEQGTRNEEQGTGIQHPVSSIQHLVSRIQYLLTAHHANDNIETVLMNFFRGTGIKGLHGIPSKQGSIVRPLLFAFRNDIEAFAKEHSLEFVTDHTNAENEFTRNYFRNELIPGIKKVYPAVEENMLGNIRRFNEVEALYRQSIELHKKKLIEYHGPDIHIPVLKLQKLKALHTIVYEIIGQFGFTASQTADVLALLKSESGKYVSSATHRVLRNRAWLIISPLNDETSQPIPVEVSDNLTHYPGGILKLQLLKPGNWNLETASHIAMLNADNIKFPLLLRKWKQGDYFYPFGMMKKKKLSRFFIDQKLSLTQKEHVWVIECDKKIIWIVGMRTDERFRIGDTTKAILKLEVSGF